MCSLTETQTHTHTETYRQPYFFYHNSDDMARIPYSSIKTKLTEGEFMKNEKHIKKIIPKPTLEDLNI